MIGGLKTKQQHNISCINQILGLNIPKITAAVRNAIRKYNIFDGDRPTNADLLYIVFECLTSYLENLNLQHVRANEQSLIKEINQIGQILQIVNVGTYLQYVDYQFRISNVISRKVSNNMVSLTLSGVYLEAEKVFKNQDKHLYAEMLDLITSVTLVTNETTENMLFPNQLRFWFQDVIPMMFDSNKEIQNSALKAVEAALPFFQLSSYQDHPNWPTVEQSITHEYSDAVIGLRESGDSVWYRTWNVLVKVLNKKLLKGSTVINKFLSICEHGFKSPNFITRAETFLCWKVLLEIYSQDAKYLSAKRIKLLLIPFKPITKTPEIAMNKFLVWWSLICKVENQIDQYYDTILIPFLWFCFGLTDRPILSKFTDGGTRQEVYPELTTLSVSALINMLGPVSDETRSFCKTASIERIQAPLRLPSLLQNVGRFLINSCGEATMLLKDIELANAIPVCTNMWNNLMDRMAENNDFTLTELIVQNLSILINASQNDEPAKKLITHAATIVMSSKNLIPINLSDDITFGILKRIALLLTNDIIYINDDALKEIVNNLFSVATGTERLQLQFQQYLTLLESQKLSSNLRVGSTIWLKIASYIEDHLAGSTETFKEVIYGYIEWLVKTSKIDQLPICLTTWKNLARFLMNCDSEGQFWHRISEILHLITSENDVDTGIYIFIVALFELINPVDTEFPPKFKFLIGIAIKSTPASQKKELKPLIDEINKFSDKIAGKHSAATFESLNELVLIVQAKCDLSLRNEFGVFNRFHKNFEKFTKSSKEKPSKSKDEEFVFIPSKWQFRPDNLTEHQKEKLKEKRTDIPALYNDMSQSQDSQNVSLKAWTPKRQLQFHSATEPRNQVTRDDLNQATKANDSTKSMNDSTMKDLQPTQSHNDSMASTSLGINTNDMSINNVDQQTPNKMDVVDAEERKRKRLQSELNKLQLSLKNAEQYSQVQGRTRRMSVNIVKPESRLRKRSQTLTTNATPTKRMKKSLTSTENSESESNEIIEASQSMPVTPSGRRTRQRRNSTSRIKDISISLPVSSPTVEIGVANSSVVSPDNSNEEIVEVNSPVQSIDVVNSPVQSTDVVNSPVQTVDVVNSVTDKSVQEQDVLMDVSIDSRSIEEQITQKNDDHVNVQSDIANIPATDIVTTTSEEVAIPEESTDHSPIEDAHSEVTTSNSETVVSPVPDNDLRASGASPVSGGIITSPSSNKNHSKTTELLNSTLDISPILHPKTSSADRSPESTNNQQAIMKTTECCNEDIDTDQIKRTDLDNLIKSPMDSPILQKKKNNIGYSTPQSHKDPKKKFQLQGGRGAQLLQLVNIRKIEDTALPKAKAPVLVSEPSTAPTETVTPNSNNLPTYEDILASNKDLFRFSKVLPSPQASPSTSIMKRAPIEVLEIDDAELNQRRKRVSFHDPPVSATKEFICFAEEVNPNRSRSNRITPLSARSILTRKNRTESLNEIRKFSLPFDDITSDKSKTSMKSLNWNAMDEDEGVIATPLKKSSSPDDLLQQVFDEFPIEDILGKYFESGHTLNDTSSKIVANQLANIMTNDENKRKYILEDLSDRFPKDFLDVTFQENLTSTVIQRLPSTDMLNYITEQAKNDDTMKTQLLEKLTSIIVDGSPVASATNAESTEMKDDLNKLLLHIISHNKMTDKQLLDVLDLIFEKRRTNSCS